MYNLAYLTKQCGWRGICAPSTLFDKGKKKKGAPTGTQTQTLWLTSPGSLPSDYMEVVNW